MDGSISMPKTMGLKKNRNQHLIYKNGNIDIFLENKSWYLTNVDMSHHVNRLSLFEFCLILQFFSECQH